MPELVHGACLPRPHRIPYTYSASDGPSGHSPAAMTTVLAHRALPAPRPAPPFSRRCFGLAVPGRDQRGGQPHRWIRGTCPRRAGAGRGRPAQGWRLDGYPHPSRQIRIQCEGFPPLNWGRPNWVSIAVPELPSGIDVQGLVAETAVPEPDR